MYAKKIKYTDFNGQEREETFYFNLTEAELANMELGQSGGLDTYIQRIIETKSVPELIELFKKFIDASYGEKSDDGKYFRKNERILDDFKSTEAYSVFYMELVSDTDAATKFITNIIPAKMRAEVEKQTNTVSANHPALKQ